MAALLFLVFRLLGLPKLLCYPAISSLLLYGIALTILVSSIITLGQRVIKQDIQGQTLRLRERRGIDLE
ncbi:MAG: hypothetical protein FWF06_00915 [Symbiobacteriaceae bacterium]|nr:hypothetical protein [Symbiobacteriaceae bacterium]